MSVTIDSNIVEGEPRWGTPDPSYENPIRYRGWNIYRWTGWKGYRGIRTGPHTNICPKCGKDVVDGDVIYVTQCKEFEFTQHYACSGDRGIVAGQWLAYKGDKPNMQYMVSCAPGEQRPFKLGESFDITPRGNQTELFYDTPLEVLEKAREEALMRLKELIDQTKRGGLCAAI